jgi:DNA-binding NtrC family response regulator
MREEIKLGATPVCADADSRYASRWNLSPRLDDHLEARNEIRMTSREALNVGRKRLLILHPRQPILRTHALLLECCGYEVTAVDSIVQMILKLEAEEDSFDGLLLEISEELRQNPSTFVRFVKEAQVSSRPALILSGRGSQEVMRAATQEGFAAAIKPIDTEEFLATLDAFVDHREICW